MPGVFLGCLFDRGYISLSAVRSGGRHDDPPDGGMQPILAVPPRIGDNVWRTSVGSSSDAASPL